MFFASIIAFFVATFLLIAIAVVVGWMAMRKITGEQTDESLREQETAGGSPLLRNERLSTISVWDSLLGKFDFFGIVNTHLEQADLNWSVGRLTSLMLLAGAAAWAFLRTPEWIPGWFALIGGVFFAALPYLYVLRLRRKRFEKFQELFPDALDSLARAMRAGYPFAAALNTVASEAVAPVSAELRKAAAEVNLGMPWSQALENLGRRVPLLEMNMFNAAVLLHARTGGKLSEVISGLAETMRENTALQGEMRALAAHGKLTGIVLTLIPVAIACIMAVVSPTYIAVLLAYPYGKDMIAAAVACLILAHFVIRRIVDLKV